MDLRFVRGPRGIISVVVLMLPRLSHISEALLSTTVEM